jgi:hypothetical protein
LVQPDQRDLKAFKVYLELLDLLAVKATQGLQAVPEERDFQAAMGLKASMGW